MFTYQVRPRIFRTEGSQPAFPAECEIRIHFRPLQPFGVEPGGGSTVVMESVAHVNFNANNGVNTFEADPPLHPRQVLVQCPSETARLEAAIL